MTFSDLRIVNIETSQHMPTCGQTLVCYILPVRCWQTVKTLARLYRCIGCGGLGGGGEDVRIKENVVFFHGKTYLVKCIASYIYL